MKLFKTLFPCPRILPTYLLGRVSCLVKLCLPSCTPLPVQEDDFLTHPCASSSQA